MATVVSKRQAQLFCRAALAGLRLLDGMERIPRRFGPDADARWDSFRGHLELNERIDLLVRDASVRWGSAFSPARVFGLKGLAGDEPMGPDWPSLSSAEAVELWREGGPEPTTEQFSRLLGIESEEIVLPEVGASTRLVVAGGAAIREVALRFEDDLRVSWSDQILVVAAQPQVRQFAGLMALTTGAREATRVVSPQEDIEECLDGAGWPRGGTALLSAAALPEEQRFVGLATRMG